jgi:superfamily II DNA helicase RecQ
MASSDDDEFDFSSDDDEALIALADQPPQPKRKRDDKATAIVSSKRLKVYPVTSHIARKVLKNTFGLSGFRLKQEEAIARLLEGSNAAVIFPTGGGKSLCYQVN